MVVLTYFPFLVAIPPTNPHCLGSLQKYLKFEYCFFIKQFAVNEQKTSILEMKDIYANHMPLLSTRRQKLHPYNS